VPNVGSINRYHFTTYSFWHRTAGVVIPSSDGLNLQLKLNGAVAGFLTEMVKMPVKMSFFGVLYEFQKDFQGIVCPRLVELGLKTHCK
jgi:hypothetical protein